MFFRSGHIVDPGPRGVADTGPGRACPGDAEGLSPREAECFRRGFWDSGRTETWLSDPLGPPNTGGSFSRGQWPLLFSVRIPFL